MKTIKHGDSQPLSSNFIAILSHYLEILSAILDIDVSIRIFHLLYNSFNFLVLLGYIVEGDILYS